jgi:YgiT-type zinc finger domain-containing protein
MATEVCFECGSGKIVEYPKTQHFQYGGGEDRVTLEARMPVFTCLDCGYEFFDKRGEFARSLAIRDYLKGKTNEK